MRVMCGARSSPPVPLSLRERGDDMPCESGSGSCGTGARRRRPNSCSSGSGAGRSRASATWRAGRPRSSSARRSSTSCGWAGATAWGSPGASCCGRGGRGCPPRRDRGRAPAPARRSRSPSTNPPSARRQRRLALHHPHERLRFGGLAAEERLLAEYAVLGFAPGGHPLSLLRGTLPPGVMQSDALSGREHATTVEVAGLVVARQRPETAKGLVFVLLEDEAGMVNVIVRPDVYERYRPAIRGEPPLWVRGKLAQDDGTGNGIAGEARGLKGGTRNAERGTNSEPDSSAFAFLRSMRRVAPESKDWG